MYPYHNRIKQRIANGELVGFEFVARYKDIAPCLLLYFSTEPFVRPIRQHRFEQYRELLKQVGLKVNDQTANTESEPDAPNPN